MDFQKELSWLIFIVLTKSNNMISSTVENFYPLYLQHLPHTPVLSISSLEIRLGVYYKFLILFSMPDVFSLSYCVWHSK